MVKLIKAEPGRYAAEEDKLWQTDKLLFSLKGQLLDGLIFQVMCHLLYNYYLFYF